MDSALVIGSGGREHAIARALIKSPEIAVVYVAPGNDGMAESGIKPTPIAVTDKKGLLQFAIQHGIAVTFVGSEAPLAAGIVDDFRQAGMAIVGPTKQAAQLESSKYFAKQMMNTAGVPTAAYHYFTADEWERANQFVTADPTRWVIKGDGLLSGKGVILPTTAAEASAALTVLMRHQNQPVVIEERLVGQEFSYFAFVNGLHCLSLGSACDYKRAYDGDQGPNTGGMGSFSPVDWVDDALSEKIRQTILQPIAKAMVDAGTPYTGVLYLGLMLTEAGVKVIEFNVRLGDPETQVLLPQLETDFYTIVKAHLKQDALTIKHKSGVSLGVVVASDGYPKNYKSGLPLPLRLPDPTLYSAGIKQGETGWVSEGGRLFMLTAQGPTRSKARTTVYQHLKTLSLPGTFYRNDIGKHRERTR
ncbi:MAG: phosphoribosylamine--glycine ligase [Aerococcus sp.]|nr:phosphoribosylamine--glycine ligase [Aerococcus sp.]